MRYSPSMNAFFADELEYRTLPGDLVRVSDEDYRAVMAARAAGKEIVARNGAPAAADPTPPTRTSAELDAIAEQVAEQELENDLRMKALGLVIADVVEQAFGVSQQVARQQVKTRFQNYYRGLIG